MEFEFRRELGGEPQAQLSMGHEAFGRFLNDECRDRAVIGRIRQGLSSVQTGQCREFQFEGREQLLLVEEDAVTIRDHQMGLDDDHELDPELNLYDAESESQCGPEDFEALLISWQIFFMQST